MQIDIYNNFSSSKVLIQARVKTLMMLLTIWAFFMLIRARWLRSRRCISGHWRNTRKHKALNIHPHSTSLTTWTFFMLIRARWLRSKRCTSGHWREKRKHGARSIHPHSAPSTTWLSSIRIRASWLIGSPELVTPSRVSSLHLRYQVITHAPP